jgi:DNA primase
VISQNINCNQAKRIDIVTYLENLPVKPTRVTGNDYWYLSPLRQEKDPSFKVNRKLNVWYDHGIGKGGNLIDLGIMIHNCTVAEFLEKLRSQGCQNTFSFHPQTIKSDRLLKKEKPKVSIKAIRELGSPELKNYLESRCITFEPARAFLKEIDIKVNGNEYSVLGLKNNSRGYELRGRGDFKSSISPKDYTIFDWGMSALAVVEGMFDFLSHEGTTKKIVPEPTDWLILNSLSFVQKAIPFISNYQRVYLLLDNDTAGREASKRLLSRSSIVQDLSSHYRDSKDLNEQIMKEKKI